MVGLQQGREAAHSATESHGRWSWGCQRGQGQGQLSALLYRAVCVWVQLLPCISLSDFSLCIWKPILKMCAHARTHTHTLFFFFLISFYNCIVKIGFLPSQFRVAFPGECQLQQSSYPTYSACWCFNVSIIHPTLTWTIESLMCAQM